MGTKLMAGWLGFAIVMALVNLGPDEVGMEDSTMGIVRGRGQTGIAMIVLEVT